MGSADFWERRSLKANMANKGTHKGAVLNKVTASTSGSLCDAVKNERNMLKKEISKHLRCM